jgi:hypothetical protein
MAGNHSRHGCAGRCAVNTPRAGCLMARIPGAGKGRQRSGRAGDLARAHCGRLGGTLGGTAGQGRARHSPAHGGGHREQAHDQYGHHGGDKRQARRAWSGRRREGARGRNPSAVGAEARVLGVLFAALRADHLLPCLLPRAGSEPGKPKRLLIAHPPSRRRGYTSWISRRANSSRISSRRRICTRS